MKKLRVLSLFAVLLVVALTLASAGPVEAGSYCNPKTAPAYSRHQLARQVHDRQTVSCRHQDHRDDRVCRIPRPYVKTCRPPVKVSRHHDRYLYPVLVGAAAGALVYGLTR
ncbi:MAG TPA: hypothetical protein ENN66_10390 [Proteobacteria bacterium]|nr:hypothetical protein [Pseudomonadota bacterium]